MPEATELPTDLVRRTERQATLFMQAYARPAPGGPAEAGWWDTVRPFLTDGAAQKLKTTPSKVPFTKVTAPPTITQGRGTDLDATVKTDAGEWVVTFQQTTDERLLVNGLTRKESKPAPSSPGTSDASSPAAASTSQQKQ